MKFQIVLRWKYFSKHLVSLDTVRAIWQQAQPSRHAVDMSIYRKDRVTAGKEKNTGSCLGSHTT
jgi:hypothetical protein